jgi:hypothetical protein
MHQHRSGSPTRAPAGLEARKRIAQGKATLGATPGAIMLGAFGPIGARLCDFYPLGSWSQCVAAWPRRLSMNLVGDDMRRL